MKYWKENLNVDIRIDGIGNLWGIAKGEKNIPPIAFGSHHDAVPNGGMYDGALGVLLATEILQTLKENKVGTIHLFTLVSFTGEEPNPFNVSTLGSKVLSGRLKKDDLEKLSNFIDGSSLQDTLIKIGGDISRTSPEEIIIKKDDFTAFLECHIEQGRRLIDADKSTSAVSCITGIYRKDVTVSDVANHAGTTVMGDRYDALMTACEFLLAFETTIKEMEKDDVVGTIGKMDVFPNASNIIPGEVKLSLEIRTSNEDDKAEILRKLDDLTKIFTATRCVDIERKLNLDQLPMPLDEDIHKIVLEAISEARDEKISLVSMAGHDAANMQRVTKSGMIFVQSKDGKSHCPDEFTDIKAIERTGNIMLDALLKMDRRL